jgi:hypothetical protein
MERIQKIYRNEGFRGFYKGYVSRVLGIGPMRATYWGVMDHTTHILEPVKQLNQWQRLVVAGTHCTSQFVTLTVLCFASSESSLLICFQNVRDFICERRVCDN